MCDLATRDRKEMMHNILDLEACYHLQLPNIGCMVEESVGVERDPVKLLTKFLPVMNHHTCTNYGISEESHGSNSCKLGGTGQGNSVSGAMCRCTSCLIFKKLEDQNLGVMVDVPISHQEVVRSAMSSVDDAEFCTNGSNFVVKCKKS